MSKLGEKLRACIALMDLLRKKACLLFDNEELAIRPGTKEPWIFSFQKHKFSDQKNEQNKKHVHYNSKTKHIQFHTLNYKKI